MNDLNENFIQLKDDLALTSEERFVMRSELERVSAVPARQGGMLSPFLFFATPARFSAALLVLLLAGSGATSALADGALPGDVLYPVKIHVNESVERTLAATPLAKADVDIKHAEERLSEVELLAAKGDADQADAKNAAAEVAANIASANDTAQDLADSGDAAEADGLSAHISSALMAHADILDAQADTLSDASDGQDLRALSFAVSATADQADAEQDADASTTAEDPGVTKEVALSRGTEVESLITKLHAALDKDGVPEETHDELLTELAAIETDYGTALALSADDNYADAGASYEKLEQRAYRALALLRSARRINAATGQDVVITLDDSTTSGDEKAALMKASAAAALAAPAASSTLEEATGTPKLEKGDASGRTLQFRVRARSWNP